MRLFVRSSSSLSMMLISTSAVATAMAALVAGSDTSSHGAIRGSNDDIVGRNLQVESLDKEVDYLVVGRNTKCPGGDSRLFRTPDNAPLTRKECYDMCKDTPECAYFTLGEGTYQYGRDHWMGVCFGCKIDSSLETHTRFTTFDVAPPNPARYKLVGRDTKCPFDDEERLHRTDDNEPVTRQECYWHCKNTDGCNYFSLGEQTYRYGSDNWMGVCILCTANSILKEHSGFTSFEIVTPTDSPSSSPSNAFKIVTPTESPTGTYVPLSTSPNASPTYWLPQISQTLSDDLANGSVLCPGFDSSDYCDCDGDCIETNFCNCDAGRECCSSRPTYHPTMLNAKSFLLPDDAADGTEFEEPIMTTTTCPEDLSLKRTMGSTPFPSDITSVVQILSQDTSTVTIQLTQAFTTRTESNNSIDQIYYQYKESLFSEKCFEENDVGLFETFVDEVTIQCTFMSSYAYLELCIVDDASKNHLIEGEDDADIPQCCHANVGNKPSVCYMFEINCKESLDCSGVDSFVGRRLGRTLLRADRQGE